MIFDERDIENFEEKEEILTPNKNQLSFDDLDKKETKKTKVSKKAVKEKVEEKSKKKSVKTEIQLEDKKDAKTDDLEEVSSKEKQQKTKETKVKNQRETVKETSAEIEQTLEVKSIETKEVESVKSKESTKSSRKTEIFSRSESEIAPSQEEFHDETTYDNEGNILKSIKSVMHESMMPYSEYVILDRALPRVEDGLKPVQRRILYSMSTLGLTPDKPFKKSAHVVGDCLAAYHPHGDTSVYNAMVRMAQNFNMREILVQGQGNYGSVDGDGAAAMRYTEAKLSELSLEMLRDIDKNTISWSYNYDDSRLEPDMLPSRFPNILVNGTSGIAVGIATNFAPHNLGEAIDACVAYIDNPNISVDELMTVLKGPDFPTGGIIVGTDGIKQAYETGKGKIIIRSKVEIENAKNDKVNLIISEFPYQVNKAMCLQKISELKENNKEFLSQITDIRDESDRKGTRAVIVLKKDSQPEKILNYLYKYSDLQVSFGINMVAIAGGKPKLLGLKEILAYYTNYQREVVLRRTEYELNQAKEREHILQGLIIAIENIDEIIKIIKNSASVIVAKQALKQRYGLSEKQAQAIMDMRLSRLTNLEVEKLRSEIAELIKLINKLEKIVKSKTLQYNLVKNEMLEIKKKYSSARRTQISKQSSEITDDDLIKVVKAMYVLVTRKNAIKKIPEKNLNKNARIITESSNLNEIHSHILLTESDKTLLLFTNFGNIYKLPVEKIIEARFKDRGLFLKDLIMGFHPDETIVFMIDEAKIAKNTYVLFTKQGMVKLTNGSEFVFNKNNIVFMKLKEDDEIVNMQIFDSKSNMIFVTKLGNSLYAKTDEIPVQLKAGIGVKGISLNEDDCVLFASLIQKESVLAITSKGYAKKVELDNFELLPKNRKGVKIYSLDKKDTICYAGLIKDDAELFCVDSKHKAKLIDTAKIVTTNRTNKGSQISKTGLGAVYPLINI